MDGQPAGATDVLSNPDRELHATGEEVLHAGFAQVDEDGLVRATFVRPTISRRIELTGVPIYAGSAQGQDTDAIGSPGMYDVTFVLSTPGDETFLSKLDLGAFTQSGTSLLQVPPGTRQITVKLTGNAAAPSFALTANAQMLVSNVIVSVSAPTFADAERAAHDLVAPMLSWWSYRYDVPIELKGWVVREQSTQATRYRFGVLARAVVTDSNTYLSKPECRFVLSAYREGMNAINPIYQALCFYRVVEGADRIRAKRRTAAGSSFREPTNEVIPAGDALAQLNFHDRAALRPYAGRAFGFARNALRELVRNAASHLDPTGVQESLIADEFADITRCEDAALVLKFMARVMLNNELRSDAAVASLM